MAVDLERGDASLEAMPRRHTILLDQLIEHGLIPEATKIQSIDQVKRGMLAIDGGILVDKRVHGQLVVGLGRAPNAHQMPLVVVELGARLGLDPVDLAAHAEYVAHLAVVQLDGQEVRVATAVVEDKAILLCCLEVKLYEQDVVGVDFGQLHPAARRLKRERVLVRQVEAIEAGRFVDRAGEIIVRDELKVGATVDDQLLHFALERVQVALRERAVLVFGELGAHVNGGVGQSSIRVSI